LPEGVSPTIIPRKYILFPIAARKRESSAAMGRNIPAIAVHKENQGNHIFTKI
jgi:hypothetical protein